MTGLLTNRQTLQKKLNHRLRTKNNLNFYALAENTLSFFCPAQTQPKKNERVFLPRSIKLWLYHEPCGSKSNFPLKNSMADLKFMNVL